MATVPLRMNLVTVRIKQIDKAATVLDSDFAEPVGSRKYGTGGFLNTDLEGQVAFNTFSQRDRYLTGDLEKSTGHIVFRASDLEERGVVLSKGDRIILIGTLEVDYEIFEVRPAGHISGRHRLMLAFFQEPTENQVRVR